VPPLPRRRARLDPRELSAGRPAGYLHLSPDCTHFSQAKGGQPRDAETRSLSWVGIKWAGTVRPDVITLENVREILKWGPLIAKRDKITGRVLKLDGTVAAPGEVVPRHRSSWSRTRHAPARLGSDSWRSCADLGYVVEWRVLCAADFGVPTTRSRLFMIARCDGRPIAWPQPTHFKEPKKGQKKWVAAHTCIDWNDPQPQHLRPRQAAGRCDDAPRRTRPEEVRPGQRRPVHRARHAHRRRSRAQHPGAAAHDHDGAAGRVHACHAYLEHAGTRRRQTRRRSTLGYRQRDRARAHHHQRPTHREPAPLSHGCRHSLRRAGQRRIQRRARHAWP
jgi:site-specific DNA-cytosine methylase